MKAISLYQPWASLIAVGAKKNETRGWWTAYRGELAVCASKHWDDDCEDFLYNELTQALLQPLNGYLREGLHVSERVLPFGCVVCVVDLHGVVPTAVEAHVIGNQESHCGNYTPGRFAWQTRNCRRLEQPVKVVGKQGLFNLPPEVEAAVRRQL